MEWQEPLAEVEENLSYTIQAYVVEKKKKPKLYITTNSILVCLEIKDRIYLFVSPRIYILLNGY